MLGVDDALSRILKLISPVGAEVLSLNDALGRRLTLDIKARISHPSVDISAMDGYAIRSTDSCKPPTSLTVIGTSAAGHPFRGSLKAGQAVRILTGASVPKGADAIAIQEVVDTHTQNNTPAIRLSKPVDVGTYIRTAGQDFRAGDIGLKAHKTLGARDIALAAAMNHPWLEVRCKPRVAILSTGDELVWPGDTASQDDQFDLAINSNGFGLAALVRGAGGDAEQLAISPDEDASLKHLIEQASSRADILVTSGGVSVGDRDRVRPALEDCGLTFGFWKIAMRPGKPLLVGTIGRTLVLGLPGNPVSALVCGLVFLLPALRRLQGESVHHILNNSGVCTATLESDLPQNDQRQDYLRAHIINTQKNGFPNVSAVSKQDSGMLQTLAGADGLIIRPPFAPHAPAGTHVPFLPFPFLV